jgi:hypothetical protein
VVKKKMEDEHKDLKRQGSRSLKRQKSRVIDALEKDQIDAHHLGKEDLDEELEDAVHDLPNEENWIEEKEGKVAPTAKAGSSEIDQSAKDERFAREHSVIVTRKSVLRDVLEQETDRPSDETPSEE